MARSTKKPPSADGPSGSAHLGEIQSILTKTRIAPDLLAGIEATRPRRTAKSTAAKPPMFDVIIEFNRSFPGGIITARLTLLSAYEKAHPSRLSRQRLNRPFGSRPASLFQAPRRKGCAHLQTIAREIDGPLACATFLVSLFVQKS
jgi:hypothetical protein